MTNEILRWVPLEPSVEREVQVPKDIASMWVEQDHNVESTR